VRVAGILRRSEGWPERPGAEGTVSGDQVATRVHWLLPSTPKPEKRDTMLNAIILVVDVIVALLLIFLILLHSGRGGGLSDMFGGGSLGGSMAGSTVVERNLDRLTVIACTIFMFTTVLLSLRLK
jgi:preprotein translocase subunit SecG